MPARTKSRRKTSTVKRSVCGSSSLSQRNVHSTKDELDWLTNKEYEPQEFLNALDVYINTIIESRRKKCEDCVLLVKQLMQEHKSKLPPSFLKINVKSDVNEDILKEMEDQNTDPNSTTTSKTRKPMHEFKKPKTPCRPTQTSSRKRSLSASSVTSSTSDRFKTPSMTSRKIPPGHTITPKIYNNTPITVMRRPGYGEMAVSLTGSPLMVSGIAQEDIPTVSVPLADGRVFSIMPEKGLPPPDLPEFDEQTKGYLRTLQKHLAILAPNTP